MRLAVIDCGTNTFRLLIADVQPDGKSTKLAHKERVYVRLGQEGLNKIGEAPFQRGIATIASFKKKMDEMKVDKFRILGTETFRRASNGRDFVRTAQETTGLEIEVISGDEEARLIHEGVMQAVPPFLGKGLIMDIGGGSVEFIICSESEVFWRYSFPVGVQVLNFEYQKNDPISQGDLAAMDWHLEEVLQPLASALSRYETPLLFGVSGSFEVVEDMLVERKHHPLFSIIPVDKYYHLHHRMLRSSADERSKMPKLPPERADLIVSAFVLIDFVIRKAGIRQIITSSYALKEGILFDMMKGQ